MESTMKFKVFSKTVETKNYTATYYHGNEVVEDPTSHTLKDTLHATKSNPTPHIVSLNVRFTKEALQTLQDSGVTFPIILTLREEDYFLTVNKDRNTKAVKLDKNGNRHVVMVVKSFEKVEKAPYKPMRMEDAYNIE